MVASARNATTSCKQITQPNGKQSLEQKKGREEERIPTIAVRKKVSGGSSCVPISSGGIAVSDRRIDIRTDRGFQSKVETKLEAER